MSAELVLDTTFNLLTFNYKDIHLTIGVPSCITSLELIKFDETGYMEFNTNVGVESMDLLYNTEHLLTNAQRKRVEEYLKSDRKIELRCISMSRVDKIKDDAYMCLSDIAFCFNKDINNQYQIIAYNINNVNQTTVFNIRPDFSFQLRDSSMSETNKYKSLAIIERNKTELIRGLKQWVNTQKKE